MVSSECQQFLRYDCFHAMIRRNSRLFTYWESREGEEMLYWAGGPEAGIGCACGITGTCANRKYVMLYHKPQPRFNHIM